MRLLVVRFSSFGDIFQALEIVPHIKRVAPESEIDWLVREDFADLLRGQHGLSNVHAFDRKDSVLRLIRLAWDIAPRYTHLYDAHSNLRSLVVRTVVRARWLLMGRFSPSRILIRSKERLRRLLYFKLNFRFRSSRFRLGVFPEPYRGAESYVKPLKNWFPQLRLEFRQVSWTSHYLTESTSSGSDILREFLNWKARGTSDQRIVAFAPSAAWPNKRWPVDRWLKLAKLLLKEAEATRFLLLGGPDDGFLKTICHELGEEVCFDAVGRSGLLESASLLEKADALIANDTGLLHVADRLQLPLVGIIGPTAFGYPSGLRSFVAEVPNAELACKPCSKDGRDPCTNKDNLKCLKLVSPELVSERLALAFRQNPNPGESI